MSGDRRIDRRSLVGRHAVRYRQVEPRAPLQVGNGEFAVTVDATGLHTFPELYPAPGRPPDSPGSLLGMQAQWAWHTIPREPEPDLAVAKRDYDTERGRVPYVDLSGRTSGARADTGSAEEQWLRNNPHRLMLGWFGLAPDLLGGPPLQVEDLADVDQVLDLWEGTVTSRFTLRGHRFQVQVAVHPERDAVAWRVESPTTAPRLRARFPYGSEAWGNAATWQDGGHHTDLHVDDHGAAVHRRLDRDRHTLGIRTDGDSWVVQTGAHQLDVRASRPGTLELVVRPVPGTAAPDQVTVPSARETVRAAAGYWSRYWTDGGALDLSGSTDQRALEVERRTVLSSFLTAINCAGSLPPQETGLMVNSWRGRFHLEMHWWHAAHFPLWGRAPLLERSMAWYEQVLPRARETAREQGLPGARWPKQVGPDGRESPSDIGPFLLWQQPHPIYLAELLRRSGAPGALERHATVVFESAELMAAYPSAGEAGLSLGPPLIPAQECYGDVRRELTDPTFEVAYWRWALDVARDWHRRLGLGDPDWWRIAAEGLASPPVRQGRYPAVRHPVLDRRRDHPSVLAALGVVPPTAAIDADVMERTLLNVLEDWDWASTWGWDYPMMAMTATRLGRSDLAVQALLLPTPKNEHLPNGHNWQTPALPVYLPGNGGHLTAVALMAAGWDGGPRSPGFPSGFRVEHEGIHPLP